MGFLRQDGRLLLYGFAGDGILDWKPEELGFAGEQKLLRLGLNQVGVFVGSDGAITEVARPQPK